MGKCEKCNGTLWYGDRGPGIRNNTEYIPCDCIPRGKHPYDIQVEELKARNKELEAENAQWKRVIVTHVDEIARLKLFIEYLEMNLSKRGGE